MEIDFWQQRWQDDQTGFHLTQVNPYLIEFWNTLQLRKDAQVLVPMCGKSLDMVWLNQQGYQVLGVECSDKAVKEFFHEQDLQHNIESIESFKSFNNDKLSLLLGDFFQLNHTLLSEVTAVYDRASLVALPEEMRRTYVDLLIRNLPENISILLVTLEYDQLKMSGPPFSVSNNEILSLYSKNFDVELLHEVDVISEQPRFKDRGLDCMVERVYKMTRSS